MDYLDFGSSSDESDEDKPMRGSRKGGVPMDSSESEEEEERRQLLKMLSIPSHKSTKTKSLVDFENEMEAELDRRANVVESLGGMEHQRSLSRSSSSSSLQSLPTTSSGGDGKKKKSAMKKSKTSPSGNEKRVKFAPAVTDASASSTSSFGNSEQAQSATTTGEIPAPLNAYDKVYFDSDESEGEEGDVRKRRKAQRKLVSNEDLLYDPNSDAADQAWIDQQRQKYMGPAPPGSSPTSKETPSTSSSKTSPEKPSPTKFPKSSAILNCPACFTVLCMDCQKHEFYAGQFRAMFTMNCKVDKSEILTVPLKPKKNKPRKKGEPVSMEDAIMIASSSSTDKFFPVKCNVCNTQVAVYDSEEIYHFFNCLSSSG